MFSQQQDNMEVAALCFRLLMTVLLLFAVQLQNCVYAQKAGAFFPRIDPNKLQFFEYDSIFVNCEELDFSSEWRVMRKLQENPTNNTQWETSTGSMTIKIALTPDSGEYWCENEEGERSNSVNITVAADVILESPSVPVMEGDSVSLDCRHKMASSNLPADFYKDGLLSLTGYKGNLLINSVSKSDEGLYKCSISGAGDSAESRLAVREFQESPSTDGSPHLSMLLSLVCTILCVAVLLLVVLLHCRKHRVGCFTSETTPGTDSVSGEAGVADSHVTYAVVTKHRKKGEPGVSSSSATQTSSAGTKPNPRDTHVAYSSIPERSLRAETPAQRGAYTSAVFHVYE